MPARKETAVSEVARDKKMTDQSFKSQIVNYQALTTRLPGCLAKVAQDCCSRRKIQPANGVPAACSGPAGNLEAASVNNF
jgi:hypothetical protein